MKTRAYVIGMLALASACNVTPPWASSPNPVKSEDAGVQSGTDAGMGTPDAGMQTPDAGPPLREVFEDTALFGRTSVNNLLVDPLLTGIFSSGLSFLPLAISGGDVTYSWALGFNRETPSKTNGAVVLAPDPNFRVTLMAQFNGGQGPFYADVWATLEAEGVETPFDPSQVTVQVGEAWFGTQQGEAVYALSHIPADDVTIDGRTWHHYAATIDEDLPATCVFAVTAAVEGVDMLVTGPQVVPQSLRTTGALQRQAGFRAYPAVRSSWSAEDKAFFEVLKKHAPSLDKPMRLRNQVAR